MNDIANPHTTGRLRPNLLRSTEQRRPQPQTLSRDQQERIRTRMVGAMLDLADQGAAITRAAMAERYGFSGAELDRHGRDAAALAARAKPDLAQFLAEMGA